MTQRSNPALSKTCKPEKLSKAALLNRTSAQRIPSRPGALCSNEGRIHLRRPSCHFHFSLATRRRTIHSGLPVIRQQSAPSAPMVPPAEWFSRSESLLDRSLLCQYYPSLVANHGTRNRADRLSLCHSSQAWQRRHGRGV